MNAPELCLQQHRRRLGLKGPRAADWLAGQGIAVPAAANSWTQMSGTSAPGRTAEDGLLIARLGSTEFFLEDGGVTAGGATTRTDAIAAGLEGNPPGVYPVLREDWAFQLSGEGAHDVLAQVCNVNFSALTLDSRPLIMTLMIGVAVLVVPQFAPGEPGAAPGRHYRIWCDPSFGPYLGGSLATVVIECGGRNTGVCG
jgi:sarcosine oxidase, subunit gamma